MPAGMHRRGSQAGTWAAAGALALALLEVAAAASGGESCATGQAAPIRIGPPFVHEDNTLELRYTNRRAVSMAEPTSAGLALLGQDFGTVVHNGEEYTVQHVSLHAPAEHALGPKPLAAELQVLHRSASNRTLGVSLLFQVGARPGRFFEDILHGLRSPLGPGGTREVHLHQGLASLLGTGSDYFAYATGASCGSAAGAEGANRWLVLAKMKKVSAAQLEALAKEAPTLAATTRPLQMRLPGTVLYSTSNRAGVRGLPTKRSQLLQTQVTRHVSANVNPPSQVQQYEDRVSQAKALYAQRLATMSRAARTGGPAAIALLQKERAQYSAWLKTVNAQEKHVREEYTAGGSAKQPPRGVAFVNTGSMVHRRSNDEDSAHMALERRRLETARRALAAQAAQNGQVATVLARREAIDAAREQRDALLEQALQQEQSQLYNEALVLQQKGQALAQAQLQLQAQAQARQYSPPAPVSPPAVPVVAAAQQSRHFMQKAHAETARDAETFRFELGSHVKKMHGLPATAATAPAKRQPAPLAASVPPTQAQPSGPEMGGPPPLVLAGLQATTAEGPVAQEASLQESLPAPPPLVLPAGG